MEDLSAMSKQQLLGTLTDIKGKIDNYLNMKEKLNRGSKELENYKQSLVDSINKNAVHDYFIDYLINDKLKNGNTADNGKDISTFNLKILQHENKVDTVIFYGAIVIAILIHHFLKNVLYNLGLTIIFRPLYNLIGMGSLLGLLAMLFPWILCIALWWGLYTLVQNFTVIKSHLAANSFVNQGTDEIYSALVNDKLTKGETGEKLQQLSQQKNDLAQALENAKKQLNESNYLSVPEEFSSPSDIDLAVHALQVGRANDWRDCTNIIHQHKIEEESRQREQKRVAEEQRHHLQMEQYEQQRIQNELNHQAMVESQNSELIDEARRNTKATKAAQKAAERAGYQADKAGWVLKDIKRKLR